MQLNLCCSGKSGRLSGTLCQVVVAVVIVARNRCVVLGSGEMLDAEQAMSVYFTEWSCTGKTPGCGVY